MNLLNGWLIGVIAISILLVFLFIQPYKKYLKILGYGNKYLYTTLFFGVFSLIYYLILLIGFDKFFPNFGLESILYILLFLGFCSVVFGTLYYNTIVKGACLNRFYLFVYILLTIALLSIMLYPLYLMQGAKMTFFGLVGIDNDTLELIDQLKLIVKPFSWFVFLYTFYLYLRLGKRFQEDSWFNILFVMFLFGGPVVLIHIMTNGKKYISCDKKLEDIKTEEKAEKKDNKTEIKDKEEI